MRTLLITPFIQGEYYCDDAVNNPLVQTEDDAALLCASEGKNAADRISSTLDALGPVSAGEAGPFRLTKQDLLIVDRNQDVPPRVPYSSVAAQPLSAEPDLSGHLDGPPSGQSVFYNPLARLWLEFRNQAVRNYLTHYAQLLADSCIPGSKVFSHQTAPSLYGSWNGDLLAVEASKRSSFAYNQGTTLYGGSAFGDAFLEMKQRLGWTRYSVSEMHPMVALSPEQYLSMFEMHRTNGALFVSPYYMPTFALGGAATSDLSRFLIAPDDEAFSSELYYRAIQNVMSQ